MEHPSATVAYSDDQEVLATAQSLLPPNCIVTLLADRGFDHGELMRWLTEQQWHWAIRAKCDLKIQPANGHSDQVGDLIAPKEEAYLFHRVTIWEDIECELATAYLSAAGEDKRLARAEDQYGWSRGLSQAIAILVGQQTSPKSNQCGSSYCLETNEDLPSAVFPRRLPQRLEQ